LTGRAGAGTWLEIDDASVLIGTFGDCDIGGMVLVTLVW
jgi:hypothetical protein